MVADKKLTPDKAIAVLLLSIDQEMAAQVQGPSQVVALPGDGHGPYVLPNTWNATRQALLAWFQQNIAE